MAGHIRIEKYDFGYIIIDGTIYRSDIILYPDHVDDSWWRREGHLLIPDDLPFLNENPPKLLVVGQGKYGYIKISSRMGENLRRLDIKLRSAKSDDAVNIYNELWAQEREKLAARFI
jgi:hypothetical protein